MTVPHDDVTLSATPVTLSEAKGLDFRSARILRCAQNDSGGRGRGKQAKQALRELAD